jgi:hypothetical protein
MYVFFCQLPRLLMPSSGMSHAALRNVPFSKKNKTCLTEPDYEDAGSEYCAADQTEERHLTQIRDFESLSVTQAADLVSCRVREQLANSSTNGFGSSSLSFTYFVCRHPSSGRNSPQGSCLLRKTDRGGWGGEAAPNNFVTQCHSTGLCCIYSKYHSYVKWSHRFQNKNRKCITDLCMSLLQLSPNDTNFYFRLRNVWQPSECLW